MTTRFLDPVAQVVIKDPDSGTEWHWGSPDYPFLTSVTLMWDGNDAVGGINIGVDMPYEYAVKALDRDPMPFKQGNIIRARIGYATGGWTEWVYGVLASGGKGLAVSPEGVAGNLEIQVVNMKTSAYTVSKDFLVDSGFDTVGVLTKMANFSGYAVKLAPGADEAINNFDIGKDFESVKTDTEQRKNFMAGLSGRSVWSAMKNIANIYDVKFMAKTINGERTLVFYNEFDITHGNVHSGYTTKQNKYVIRGIVDPDNNQYPCFGISPTEDESLWLNRVPTGAASGVTARAIDDNNNEDVTFEAYPEGQEDARDGQLENTVPKDLKVSTYDAGEMIIDAFKQDGKPGTYMSAPILPGGLEMFKSQARRFQRDGDIPVKIDISTIGVPGEQVGNLCQLWNATWIFNGVYCIEKVVQSWSPGTWDMTLGAYRRGARSIVGPKKDPAGGQLPK